MSQLHSHDIAQGNDDVSQAICEIGTFEHPHLRGSILIHKKLGIFNKSRDDSRSIKGTVTSWSSHGNTVIISRDANSYEDTKTVLLVVKTSKRSVLSYN